MPQEPEEVQVRPGVGGRSRRPSRTSTTTTSVRRAVTFDTGRLHSGTAPPWLLSHPEDGPHRLLVAGMAEDVGQAPPTARFWVRHEQRVPRETGVLHLRRRSPSTSPRHAAAARHRPLLYKALFEALADEDVHRAYAGIAQPNEASARLHERFGVPARRDVPGGGPEVRPRTGTWPGTRRSLVGRPSGPGRSAAAAGPSRTARTASPGPSRSRRSRSRAGVEVAGGLGRAEGDEERGEVLGARVGQAARPGTCARSRAGRPRRRPPAPRWPQSSNSADQAGTPGPVCRSAARLWVKKPLPTISTPSSRSGASLRPMSIRRRGSSVGMEIWSTGMSASGNISTSGTYAPWSRPRSGMSWTGVPGAAQQLADRGGELGGARGVVADLVVVLGEAPEVVDERHGLGGAEGERGLLPVGGDHQDRRGAGQARGPGGQLAGPERVVGQRRRAVAEVEGRHAGPLRVAVAPVGVRGAGAGVMGRSSVVGAGLPRKD